MNEEAKAFLARVVPWRDAHEETTFINLHWTFLSPGNSKPGWGGRACRSQLEAMNALDFALKSPSTKDIYVCMSSQSTAKPKVGKNNYQYFLPQRSKDNAVELNSFYLDIDVKSGDNGYATIDDAASALADFVNETGLPRPTIIVKSGGGLHCYWSVDRHLSPLEWSPLANALAECAKAKGLHCDTQVTVDAARILRVPGTLNHKTVPPKSVAIVGTPLDFKYTVDRIKVALSPYMNSQVTTVSNLKPLTPLQGTSDLGSNMPEEPEFKVKIDGVVKECAFVREALQTGGKDYDNPRWNLTTLIASFCEDGRQLAHLMGNKHAGYSNASTDDFYDRKSKEQHERGLGWPSCATISSTGCRACQNCPHFGKIKGPLNLAARAIPQPVAPSNNTITQDDMPEGFVRLQNGLIAKNKDYGDGVIKPIPIGSRPIYTGFLENGDVMKLHFKTDTIRRKNDTITVEFGQLGGHELRKVCAEQGFFCPSGTKNYQELQEFFVAWIDELNATKGALKIVPFGWLHNTKSGDLEGFVYDSTVFSKGKESEAVVGDKVLASTYSPSGKYEVWREASKFLTDQKRPSIDFILAAAFAAPLLELVGGDTPLINAYSTESGYGKTAAMRISQAVWADPTQAMKGLDDTSNRSFLEAGKLTSLPLYWDELKYAYQLKAFAKALFRLSGGSEKARTNTSLQIVKRGVWKTMMISACNDSLIEYVTGAGVGQSDAGLYRIFEYHMEPIQIRTLSQAQVQVMVNSMNRHNGHAGRKYSEFLGKNPKKYVTEVIKEHDILHDELKATPPERNWLNTIASCLVGARYANELDLTDIDLDAMRKFGIQTFERMRNERSQLPNAQQTPDDTASYLNEFVKDHARHVLYTNLIPKGRGRVPHGQITIVRDHKMAGGEYHIRIGMNDKMMRFSRSAFYKWCQENGHNKITMRDAVMRLGATERNARLTAGTTELSFYEVLWELDISSIDALNFIDDN